MNTANDNEFQLTARCTDGNASNDAKFNFHLQLSRYYERPYMSTG